MDLMQRGDLRDHLAETPHQVCTLMGLVPVATTPLDMATYWPASAIAVVRFDCRIETAAICIRALSQHLSILGVTSNRHASR